MFKRASLSQEAMADLRFSLAEDGGNGLARALTNRGFHALLAYRIAHRLQKTPLSFIGYGSKSWNSISMLVNAASDATSTK